MIKEYKTPYARGFCRYWSKAKATMEFITNGLDSSGEFSYEVGDTYVVLRNEGVKLTAKTLLMGLSMKDEGSIGFHGCGFSQAITVLLAQGASVSIENDDVLWTPSFKYNDDYDEDTIHVEEASIPSTNALTITVSNLEPEDIEELKTRCLYFQDAPEELFKAPNCDVFGREQKGNIYVAGIFVEHKPTLEYGYNFDVHTLKLNQDRESVNDWDLGWEVSKIWGQYAPMDLLEQSLIGLEKDTEYSNKYTNKEFADQVAQNWIDKNKNTVIVSDYTKVDEYKEKGVTAKYVSNSNLTSVIESSTIYQEVKETLEEDVEEEVELEPYEIVDQFAEKIFEEVDSLSSTQVEDIKSIMIELSALAESWYE